MLPGQQFVTLEVNIPLSLVEAAVGLALLFGPRLIRWWKRRRNTRP